MIADPTKYYQNKTVAKDYDRERFSSVSGHAFNALEKYNVRKAFHGLARGSTIADIPCGTGRLAEVLLADGFRVTGMDISDPMLNVARNRLSRFGDQFDSFVVDALDPKFTVTAQYDAVLCARVLMHFPLPRQIAFLRNVARLARDRVVLTQSWASPYQSFRRKVKRVLGHQPSASYPVSRGDCDALMNGAGLRVVRRIRPCAPISEEVVLVCSRCA